MNMNMNSIIDNDKIVNNIDHLKCENCLLFFSTVLEKKIHICNMYKGVNKEKK